ncbi:hypothetical protein M8C21_013916, partial [Ambrosia artemisiifolia]
KKGRESEGRGRERVVKKERVGTLLLRCPSSSDSSTAPNNFSGHISYRAARSDSILDLEELISKMKIIHVAGTKGEGSTAIR